MGSTTVPSAWVMIDGALVRRTVTDVDVWVEWRLHVEKLITDHQKSAFPIPHGIRLGQKVVNSLATFRRRDILVRTAGALCDPFHNDDNIPAFLQLVDDTWEVYGTD